MNEQPSSGLETTLPSSCRLHYLQYSAAHELADEHITAEQMVLRNLWRVLSLILRKCPFLCCVCCSQLPDKQICQTWLKKKFKIKHKCIDSNSMYIICALASQIQYPWLIWSHQSLQLTVGLVPFISVTSLPASCTLWFLMAESERERLEGSDWSSGQSGWDERARASSEHVGRVKRGTV